MTNNILKYLERLEKIEAGASKSPWYLGHCSECDESADIDGGSGGLTIATAVHRRDQAFICSVRNEFPKLLSAMREMVSRLRIIHEEVSEGYNVKTEASMVLEKVEQILCETNKGEK